MNNPGCFTGKVAHRTEEYNLTIIGLKSLKLLEQQEVGDNTFAEVVFNRIPESGDFFAATLFSPPLTAYLFITRHYTRQPSDVKRG